ncbi:MAG: IclR family transcriptional regulator, partial [Candidatus Bipolaricaulis sp.]|nr:IclR family transcriptional regulator [Candidatus Bipolaricaulis sp.]
MDKTSPSARKYENKSLHRAFVVLDLFDSEASHLTASEIAAALGLRPGTIYPTLCTMEEHGYVERDEHKRYRLGLKFLERSSHILSHLDVRSIAQPHLRSLARELEGNTHLAVLYEREVLYLHREEGQPTVILNEVVGRRVPAYCTALGKVLLAHLPDEDLLLLLRSIRMQPLTPNTILKKEQLMEELRKTQSMGYGTDREEFHVGSTCLAAPLRNHTGAVLAAISVSLPTNALSAERERKVVESLVRCAQQVSS